MITLNSVKIASLLLLLVLVALFCSPLIAQRGGSFHEDPAGEWVFRLHQDAMERVGPELGDYAGVPLNDAARYAADNWDANVVGLPENMCKGHSPDHSWREVARAQIWEEVDKETQQVVAYRTFLQLMGPQETFYMDGRPHPPDYVPYTWQGFSTAKWERGILAVTTDHMKNNLLKWNGIPRSERAVLSRHFLRHDDYLTIAYVVYDPAYLTEPFMGSLDFVYTPGEKFTAYPCESVTEVDRPEGTVPSRMPGANEFLNEFPARYGIPPEAARGGAETMYPEYIAKMKGMKLLPRPAGTHTDR